jgi:hypothetical protein
MPTKKTTANERKSAIDPGGTKPAPTKKTAVKQVVKSGDRNDRSTTGRKASHS